MNAQQKERLYKTIAKLGTILVDRRFITAAVSLVVLFFGVEETEATEIVKAVSTVLVSLILILSWTFRQPTGLAYQNPAIQPPDLDHAIEKFLEQRIGIRIE